MASSAIHKPSIIVKEIGDTGNTLSTTATTYDLTDSLSNYDLVHIYIKFYGNIVASCTLRASTFIGMIPGYRVVLKPDIMYEIYANQSTSSFVVKVNDASAVDHYHVTIEGVKIV